MGVKSWYFGWWKSRGKNIRLAILRDVFAVLIGALLLLTVIGVWLFNDIRTEMLSGSSERALIRAVKEYEVLISNQNQDLTTLAEVLEDTLLSRDQQLNVLHSFHKRMPFIKSLMVIDSNEIYFTSRVEEEIQKKSVQNFDRETLLDFDNNSGAYFSAISEGPVVTFRKAVPGRNVVVQSEMNLKKINSFFDQIDVSQNGKFLLFDLEERSVFISESGEQIAGDIRNTVFKPYQSSESEVVREAFRAMPDSATVIFPVKFKVNGQLHWMRSHRVEDSQGAVYIGVIVPESDILGVIQSQLGFYFLALLVALLIGGFILFLIISRYSRQIKNLPQLHVDESRAEQEILNLITQGEHVHLEFKSAVRFNNKTQTNDKRLEIAWVKGVAGFLNTEGGILLIGVRDDGEVIGIAHDGFENEDKCLLHTKNVITRYLGNAVNKNVTPRVVHINGLMVLVIEVEPKNTPTYLKDGNQDLFYVRTGPSSTKLSLSETVDYVAEHW